MLRNLQTLKIEKETHTRLKHLAIELDVPLGDLATAILEDAINKGSKHLWRITEHAGLYETKPDTKNRLAVFFRALKPARA